MIQLNSQEITEATELHPVTTCEQGRREDGKTGGLSAPKHGLHGLHGLHG